jgi:hypothetical protein
MWAILASTFLFPLSVHAGEFSLAFKEPGLDAGQARIVQDFLAETVRSLPEKVKSQLNRKITITFKNLTALDRIPIPDCRPAEAGGKDKTIKSPLRIFGQVPHTLFGKDRIREILIDKSILHEILGGRSQSRDFNCGHKNTTRFAKSVLIHEIGHLYDYMNVDSREELEQRGRCDKLTDREISADPVCRDLKQKTRSLSQHPYFLNMTGWTLKGLLVPTRTENLNSSFIRTPDKYEFHNPEEAFAVNFEYFLLDPGFRCRRPTLFRFLKAALHHSPFPDAACVRQERQLPITTQYMSADVPSHFAADLSRLYEIDYLHASSGGEMLSSFGHSMFRLVFCRPGEPLGPACRLDTAHHIVVSFRAEVDDLKLDTAKGFKGKYPARMFLMPMNEVIDEYTKLELRSLYSLPLKLNRGQIAAFLDRVVELYWNYKGKYYFFSNNCAVESLGPVQAAYPDLTFQNETITTPNGLMEAFIRHGLIDRSILNNEAEAIDNNYLYRPVTVKLRDAFLFMNQHLPELRAAYGGDLKRYLNDSKAAERAKFLAAIAPIAGEKTKASLYAAFLMIEDQQLKIYGLRMMKDIGTRFNKFLEGRDKQFDGEFIERRFREVQDFFARTQPERYVQAGYGIPFAGELHGLTDEQEIQLKSRMKDLFKEIKTWAERHFKQFSEELKRIQENRIESVKLMSEYVK